MRHGADWYHRYPQNYLGGVIGLTAKQHCVYAIVLEMLYAYGGEIRNDPAWIAGWIADMGAAAVRNTLAELFDLGKLIENEGKITEKRAKNAAKTKENLSENGRKMAQKRWKNEGQSEEKQSLTDAGCIAETHADKIREDILEPIGSNNRRKTDLNGVNVSRETLPPKPTPRSELERTLDPEHAEAVLDHRKKIRKPLTAHAAKLLAGKFARCRDPAAAADAMIANGWQGFEPEWMENRNGRHAGETPQKSAGTVDVVRRLLVQARIDDEAERKSLSDRSPEPPGRG